MFNKKTAVNIKTQVDAIASIFLTNKMLYKNDERSDSSGDFTNFGGYISG
jgi:hypothetical protein